MTDEDQQYRAGAETRAALLADPERSHRGEVTLSIETSPDTPLCFDHLVADNVGAFFRLMRDRGTPGRERDVLISYYVLGLGQTGIGAAFGMTQSGVKGTLRVALSRLSGAGSRATRVKHQTIHRSDPPCVGQFRISVSDVKTVMRTGSNVRSGSGADCAYES